MSTQPIHRTAAARAQEIVKALSGDTGKLVEVSLRHGATPYQMVRAFHALYDMPRPKAYTPLTPQRMAMRAGLVVEELQEFFYKAFGITMTCQFTVFTDDANQENAEQDARAHLEEAVRQAEYFDPIEGADAAGDSIYVWVGLFIELGINLDDVLREIHASNMTKLGEDGTVLRREDGKVLKGPNYMPPQIDAVLEQQFTQMDPEERALIFAARNSSPTKSREEDPNDQNGQSGGGA